MCDPSPHGREHGLVCTYFCGGAVLPLRDGAEPRHHTMNCLEPFDPFGSHPILFACNFHHDGAILKMQPLKEFSPVAAELPPLNAYPIAEYSRLRPPHPHHPPP